MDAIKFEVLIDMIKSIDENLTKSDRGLKESTVQKLKGVLQTIGNLKSVGQKLSPSSEDQNSNESSF